MLTAYSGMTNEKVIEKYNLILDFLFRARDEDEELGGGSPLESTYERLNDLEIELVKRKLYTTEELDRMYNDRKSRFQVSR